MSTLTRIKSLLVAGAALASFPAAQASLSGFTDFSLGGTTAGWDIYYGANYLPTFTFATGTVGNPIVNAGSNLSLVANVPGYVPGNYSTWATGPTGSDNSVPGDRELFYTFFASPVNFSITSIVAAGDGLDTFAFQSLTSMGSAGGLSSVLLNGVAATATGTNENGVDFWTWSGLDLAPGSTVTLTFDAATTMATQHSAFDAFQIQSDSVLTAVPEPSTTAVAVAVALAGVVLIRRRRIRGA